MVSKVTGSLTIQVLFDRLPINHLIQLQQWETVNVFGNHGLGGLLEEGGHGKSPKYLGGNLGDFAKDSGRLKNLSGGLLLLNFVSDYTTERNRI